MHGQRRLVAQALEREAHRERAQAELFRRLGDAEQIHPASPDLAEIAQPGLRKIAPIVRADHPQRRRAAVHRVELRMKGKALPHLRKGAVRLFPPGRQKDCDHEAEGQKWTVRIIGARREGDRYSMGHPIRAKKQESPMTGLS